MISAKQIENLKDYIASAEPSRMGKFFYRWLPYRKKIVLANMQTAFGHYLNAAEIEKLAQCFYSHLWLLLLENLQFPFLSNSRIKQRVVIKGIEHVENLERQKKASFILITGHFGNWEMAPLGVLLHHPRYRNRIAIIRKKIDALPWLEKILFRRYNEAGFKVIASKNALIRVYKELKRDTSMIFVMDQHASIDAKDGIIVDFFAKKAGTYKSPALLAQRVKAPVIPIKVYRGTDKKHKLEILPPLAWISHENPEEELLLNTRKYNESLEQIILEHPEQWLWTHRRWKL